MADLKLPQQGDIVIWKMDKKRILYRVQGVCAWPNKGLMVTAWSTPYHKENALGPTPTPFNKYVREVKGLAEEFEVIPEIEGAESA